MAGSRLFALALALAALFAVSRGASPKEYGVEDYSCVVVYAGRLLEQCVPTLEAIEEAYPFDSSSAPDGVSVDIPSDCCDAAKNLLDAGCACSSNVREMLKLLGHPTSDTGYDGIISILSTECKVPASPCTF